VRPALPDPIDCGLQEQAAGLRRAIARVNELLRAHREDGQPLEYAAVAKALECRP